MARSQDEDMRALLVHSMLTLPMIQNRLAKFLGVSDRTMRRWVDGGVRLDPTKLLTLATAVHAKDPALAARIAAAHDTTLEDLGLGLPPERRLAYEMALAAGEVAGVSVSAMRPALAAALGRAREAGLTMDAAHALFAAPSPPTKKR
jgi:hypothetical protein